jgi:hypothetical protein
VGNNWAKAHIQKSWVQFLLTPPLVVKRLLY